MKEKLLFQIKYIRLIKEQDGILCLEVQDMELWDFVQGYLWDNFQITESTVAFPDDGSKLHKSYYSPDVDFETLVEVLSRLNVKEVERIYKLNN